MDPRRPELSFVLPAHNEAQNVAAMAAALAKVAAPLGSHEIVFVDDGSTDETLAEIKALAARHEAVRYVAFTRNFGHQAALRAGLHHARGLRVAGRAHTLDEGASLPGEESGRHHGEPGQRVGEGHRLALRLL